MPNHITNEIRFGEGDQAKTAFQQMLEDMRAPDESLGSFDFNKLIPMPESLNIEAGSRTDRGLKLYRQFMQEGHGETNLPSKWKKIAEEEPEVWSLGRQAYHNQRQYGATTWYDWCIQNWGTKWNAYSPSLDIETNTLVFETAWSSVPKLVKILSEKYPEQNITYRWADEDIGNNVGKCEFQSGDVIWADIPTPGSREAYEMAADIQGVELADYNLYLTPDGSAYEYRDEPFPEPMKQPKSNDLER